MRRIRGRTAWSGLVGACGVLVGAAVVSVGAFGAGSAPSGQQVVALPVVPLSTPLPASVVSELKSQPAILQPSDPQTLNTTGLVELDASSDGARLVWSTYESTTGSTCELWFKAEGSNNVPDGSAPIGTACAAREGVPRAVSATIVGGEAFGGMYLIGAVDPSTTSIHYTFLGGPTADVDVATSAQQTWEGTTGTMFAVNLGAPADQVPSLSNIEARKGTDPVGDQTFRSK